MKNLTHPIFELWRLTGEVADRYGMAGNPLGGCFQIPRNGQMLRVIASNGEGWDHISVSLQDRCPTWDEMEFIAQMFFKAEEVACQLHVPAADHINRHPYCLHWWRPHYQAIPLPPKDFV